jgi:hypothetical protein
MGEVVLVVELFFWREMVMIEGKMSEYHLDAAFVVLIHRI